MLRVNIRLLWYEVNDALLRVSPSESTFLMGDFNAHILHWNQGCKSSSFKGSDSDLLCNHTNGNRWWWRNLVGYGYRISSHHLYIIISLSSLILQAIATGFSKVTCSKEHTLQITCYVCLKKLLLLFFKCHWFHKCFAVSAQA